MADYAIRSGGTGLQSAFNFAAVTPSDSVDLAYITRAIYVGGAGDVSVLNASGATVVFTAVPAGTVLPISTARIRASGTGATAIVALF
jgi:hypothetical protein